MAWVQSLRGWTEHETFSKEAPPRARVFSTEDLTYQNSATVQHLVFTIAHLSDILPPFPVIQLSIVSPFHQNSIFLIVCLIIGAIKLLSLTKTFLFYFICCYLHCNSRLLFNALERCESNTVSCCYAIVRYCQLLSTTDLPYGKCTAIK